MSTAPRSALVAVQDSETRLSLRWILDREGFVVRTATHFAGAREMVPGDLLITDLDFGRRSAFELVRAFQHRGFEPWTLVVAPELDPEDVRSALGLGVRGWLSTPIEEREVTRALAAVQPASAPAESFVGIFEASPETTERVPREVAAFALRRGIGPACRARIAGACGDLLENVERHAYPGGSGPVEVRAEVTRGELELVVKDQGIGFDPVLVTTGSMSRSLDGGLARCTALSESVQLEAAPGEGTTARVTFSADTTQFDDGETADLSDLDYLSPASVRRVLETLEHEHAADLFHLSPALAVIVGRLLVGPDPRRALQMAMWS